MRHSPSTETPTIQCHSVCRLMKKLRDGLSCGRIIKQQKLMDSKEIKTNRTSRRCSTTWTPWESLENDRKMLWWSIAQTRNEKVSQKYDLIQLIKCIFLMFHNALSLRCVRELFQSPTTMSMNVRKRSFKLFAIKIYFIQKRMQFTSILIAE